MITFIVRSFFKLLITLLLVSIIVFAITEASPGNLARNVLGAFVTPEQEQSFIEQMGLDEPAHVRYLYWLFGSDMYAMHKTKMELVRIKTEDGFFEWWVKGEDGKLLRWKLEGENLIAVAKDNYQNGQNGGKLTEYIDNERWEEGEGGVSELWGVDKRNNVVLWEKGSEKIDWTFVVGSGWLKTTGGPRDYIPLKKGFIRGDPGVSLRTGRPVSKSLFIRFRNSLVLAGIAFIIVMPLALALGIIAGTREGSIRDRVLSIAGIMFSVTPEFATGIFLILIVSVWLGLVPGATVFGEMAPWERPEMLILPVLTLTLVELGYILRITRASMVEVMRAPYIRTAYLKGLTSVRVILIHAIKNALIAPITVIMLHINWLLGGIVVVEVVFGYPGLGKYLLESALYKDVNALEAGTMIMVLVAVLTQFIADIIYTFLNPKIRYE